MRCDNVFDRLDNFARNIHHYFCAVSHSGISETRYLTFTKFTIQIGICSKLKYMKFSDVNWGSSTQAQTYKTALMSTYRISNMGEHAKNYRPQILVLSGKPQSRPPLIDLANLITKHNSLLLCGDISPVIRPYKYRNVYLWNSKIFIFFIISVLID